MVMTRQMFRRRRKPRATAERVTIADIDTGHHGDLCTTIPRPESFVPLDHSAATAPVDPNVAAAQSVDQIRRLLERGSLDDLTSDVLDAAINASRAEWDVTVEREAFGRLSTTLDLMAAQLQYITQVQQALTRVRRRHNELNDAIDHWRGELLGKPVSPRVEATATPADLGLESHITQALAGREPVPVTYLRTKGA